jgi:hypothetical protein
MEMIAAAVNCCISRLAKNRHVLIAETALAWPRRKGISVLDTLRVRPLAHQLWEQQGRPNGQELDHWLEAERRLNKDHKTLGKLKRNKRDVDGKKKKKKGCSSWRVP